MSGLAFPKGDRSALTLIIKQNIKIVDDLITEVKRLMMENRDEEAQRILNISQEILTINNQLMDMAAELHTSRD